MKHRRFVVNADGKVAHIFVTTKDGDGRPVCRKCSRIARKKG